MSYGLSKLEAYRGYFVNIGLNVNRVDTLTGLRLMNRSYGETVEKFYLSNIGVANLMLFPFEIFFFFFFFFRDICVTSLGRRLILTL